MNHFYNNKEDAMRDKLLQHEFAPVSGAWDKMSALLDEYPPVAKRPFRAVWAWSATALLLMGSVMGGGYYLCQTTPEEATPSTPAQTVPAPTAVSTTAPLVAQTTVPAAPSTTKAITNVVADQNSAPATPASEIYANVTPEASANATTASTGRTQQSYASDRTSTQLPPTVETNYAALGTAPQMSSEKEEINTAVAPLSEKEAAIKAANINNRPVLKRRTEIIYQYSTTPLRTLQQEQKRLLQPYNGDVGTFGITEELEKPSSPISASAYLGASGQLSSAQQMSIRPIIGAQVDYKISKHHAVQVGAQYRNLVAPDHTSSEYSSSTGHNNGYRLQEVDVLDFPVAYQFHPHPRYHLKAGVQTSVLLNARTTIPSASAAKDLSLSTVGVSLLVGVEYELSDHWSIALQYNWGAMDLTTGGTNENSTELTYNYQVSQSSSMTTPTEVTIPNNWRGSDLQLLIRYKF